ncbi:hypothetical protein P3T76_006931 [Phytophthora citrophthora]|uniref:Uncharacterized protein n=1 Tax=Phytophthora citrophthora TaxID=4793 RepID=A0AAD9GNJ8_9STRA|nr:hypothetical protein P3T76_006931 [Phytophthora citrophthora]
MLFELMSWCFDDYKKAVLNDNFFCHVEAMFPPYSTQSDPEKEAKERIKLLKEKYFIAGGNARVVFEASAAMAIEELDKAIMEAPNLEPYLKGFAGDSSVAVNRLLAWYVAPLGHDVRLVSNYVVRHFATVMGPCLVQNFVSACNVNPSMNGFLLEAWFFAELSRNDLAWGVRVGNIVEYHSWERSNIVFFDPEKQPIGISLDVPKWMAPVKWNQGGYDAVFIDKTAQLVRFVHVMHAEYQTFHAKHFIALLNRLIACDMIQVAVIELCFVVQMARLVTFELPVSKDDFKKIVVEVTSSSSHATQDQTSKDCRANVMVIGVDYEIFY